MQLQKFAVTLHCQQKRMAQKRPPVGSSLIILTTVRRCGGVLYLCAGEMPVSEMLVAYGEIVGSRVVRTIRVKSDNLSVCHDVMRRE